ncbi:MAG: lytic transglycosylase domain-containing protein [Lentisphaeria bacterium]|nr:lytic transglycosylase domain-containing protein [Lentisphaeria bacterium]
MKYSISRGTRRSGRKTHFPLLLLIFVFAAAASFFLWRTGEFAYDYFTRSSRYDGIIRKAAIRNRIDPALVKAVIWRESRFDRSARGLKGEIGLMQIMPDFAAVDWAKAHRCKVPARGALYDPELNIDIGSWYLARALRRYSRYKDAAALALCEYNAGARRTADWKPADVQTPVLDRITIPSTRSYVNDILARYDYYKKQNRPKK